MAATSHKTATVALLILALAAPAGAGELVGPPEPRQAHGYVEDPSRQRWGWGEALIIGFGAADLITTEIAYAADVGHEGNPLMTNRAVRLVVKPAYTALVVWTYRELRKRGQHGWAKFLLVAVVTFWAGATAWNISQIHG